ncbi:PAS domain-containing protein [Flectobacillus longus]|uniref:PAS domain-containing protein n=1 Tax=Flectobacillus longus TaxID=2984207 RepID=UPI0024B83D72|nr:PAS domain-containing protein [Flectobacillus longus]MDI9879523.1 PAS domain-containing protein [Flectobacillus longus]
MMQLSPKTFCDTFSSVNTSMPILTGMEFMRRPARLSDALLHEYECVSRMAHVRKWDFDLYHFRDFIQDPQHAVVITNVQQTIQWVNHGFANMTGYQIQEALGKKPSFLQGKETDPLTRSAIKACLLEEKKFEGKLINYRKDGEPYWCDVRIEPIFNEHQKLVNFIAFEEEIV